MNDTLIIFDIDGTLTESVAAHQQCYTHALEKRGLKKDGSFGDFLHHTDRYIFREIFRQNNGRLPDENEVQSFYQSVTHCFEQKAINEVAGAAAFMQQLVQAHIPYVFATGSILQPALKKLSVVGITDAAHLLATSDHMDSREDIVLDAVAKAEQHYGQQFEQKIIVGDGKWDYLTAQNLKMSFFGIGDNPALSELIVNHPQALWKDFSNRTYTDMLSSAIELSKA